MFEMSHARDEHRHAQLVGLFQRVLVAHAASGLHERRDTVAACQRDGIVEGEEPVGGEHETLAEACGGGLFERYAG